MNQPTKEKGKEMKANRINTAARMTGLVIALALFAGVAGEVRAQEKGATRLLRLSGTLVEPKAGASDYKPMSCAKCKDEYITRTDWSTRGANKPDILVARHLCGGCDTATATVGRGKQAHDVATHKCTSCGAETLAGCSTKGGSETATNGMEKKFEIAPIK